jgi:hypothetical protein
MVLRLIAVSGLRLRMLNYFFIHVNSYSSIHLSLSPIW